MISALQGIMVLEGVEQGGSNFGIGHGWFGVPFKVGFKFKTVHELLAEGS